VTCIVCACVAAPSTPVIMIGAGSGFAPLRGFMQERVAMKQSGVGLGPSQLYFGCMKRNLDFIYQVRAGLHTQRIAAEVYCFSLNLGDDSGRNRVRSGKRRHHGVSPSVLTRAEGVGVCPAQTAGKQGICVGFGCE
jgi:hypothetical protein